MQEDSPGSAKADEAGSKRAICSKGRCDSHTKARLLLRFINGVSSNHTHTHHYCCLTCNSRCVGSRGSVGVQKRKANRAE